MSESRIAALLHIGAGFTWNGHRLLMHWTRPAAVTVLYLLGCFLHNNRLRKAKPTSTDSTVVEVASIVHNAMLVVFSFVVFVASTYHWLCDVAEHGLHHFLCHPLAANGDSKPPPLAGPLHWWCYIFYLSKYYELIDTLLLVVRNKRIIVLHAVRSRARTRQKSRSPTKSHTRV